MIGNVRLEVTEQPRLLARLSVIQEWIDHPLGERLVRPLISGPVKSPLDPTLTIDLSYFPDVFLIQLLIAKLALKGLTIEERIAEMVEEANTT